MSVDLYAAVYLADERVQRFADQGWTHCARILG